MTVVSWLEQPVIVVLFTSIVLGLALTRRPRRPRPTLQRAGSGYVLLREQSVGHHCDPPGSDHVATSASVSAYSPDARWTDGDLWLCECGRAWKASMRFGSDHFFDWCRSERDDVSPLQ